MSVCVSFELSPGVDQKLTAYSLQSSLVVVQLLSCVPLFATPWTPMQQAPLSFTVSWSLLKLMFIELVMPFNHLILLPTFFPRMRVFASELVLQIRGSKYWSFSISPSNEYSGLIPFRISLQSKGLSRVFSNTTV